MKKRIFSLLLALVLCLSLVCAVNAATANLSDTTTGGTAGTSGVSATLFVNGGQTRSSTNLDRGDNDASYLTSITYYYTTEDGVHTSRSKRSYTDLVGVVPVDGEITSASSYHYVDSPLYGNWSTSLSAYT